MVNSIILRLLPRKIEASKAGNPAGFTVPGKRYIERAQSRDAGQRVGTRLCAFCVPEKHNPSATPCKIGNPMQGKEVCGAKTRSGKSCQNAPMANGRCRMHGGSTPRAAESPHFKTGRYSKYAPKKLLGIYEEAQSDPDLLSVREDIGLIDALLKFKLKQLFDSEGERHADSFETWKSLKALVADARKAYKSESYASLEKALDEMEDIANLRLYRYSTEQEIKDDIERRRKLVETEQKISLQAERALPAEQVMMLMTQVLDVIKTVVTDERQRFAIAHGLQQLVAPEVS
jgi:hypothetical protein